MRRATGVVNALAGEQRPEVSTTPPLNGPRNTDEAAADFANRLLLIARSVSTDPKSFPGSWTEVLRAVDRSFRSIERDDLRQWMALPLQVPLSFGALLARSGLRGLHASRVAGVENLPKLFMYSMEFFTDMDIFVPLQYNNYLSGLVEDVQRDPRNAKKRLLLGKTYTKLGR